MTTTKEDREKMLLDKSEVSDYFEWFRRDIVDLVPHDAKTILSVGCGGGLAESTLKERGSAVLGIEMDTIAAHRARERGIDVIEGDVEKVFPQLQDRSFDCLIYADVLEHTRSPEGVLKDHSSLLNPGGSVVISVPNFRHYSVFWSLLVRGEFLYSSSGIFDETHLRITTRKSVVRWVEDLGMSVVHTKYNIFRRRHRLLSFLTCGALREFLAYQILIVARSKQ